DAYGDAATCRSCAAPGSSRRRRRGWSDGHIHRQFLLSLADVYPHIALRSPGLGSDLQILRRERIVRRAESSHSFIAATTPSALLDAESVNRDSARFRRDDQVEREGAILLTAFDDVARLNKDVLVRAVLDGQSVHVAGLAHDYKFALHRLLQGQRC